MTWALGLEAIPAGVDVFVDANIFVYGLGKGSPQCQELLARCSREELYGVTLYDVVADVTHRLMIAEALSKELIDRPAASVLRAKPELVSRLADYWTNTLRLLDLNLMVLGVDEAITVGAQAEREQAGLLTRDSLVVACMRSLDLRYLATADRDFERVEGIVAYSPSDV